MYQATLASYKIVIFMYKAPLMSIWSVRLGTLYTEHDSKLIDILLQLMFFSNRQGLLALLL